MNNHDNNVPTTVPSPSTIPPSSVGFSSQKNPIVDPTPSVPSVNTTVPSSVPSVGTTVPSPISVPTLMTLTTGGSENESPCIDDYDYLMFGSSSSEEDESPQIKIRVNHSNGPDYICRIFVSRTDNFMWVFPVADTLPTISSGRD